VTDPTNEIAARLERRHARLIDLSLDRLRTLLARLDHPEQRLPPVIHVAGTNGKGSTCAFIRGMAEAAGLRVHVYTTPHLIRLNERIRLAGTLVSDDRLTAALEWIERVNDGAPITVFEVITATAFTLFADTPADLCVLEVGLGGRRDATNVISAAAASAITSISLDHRDLLGPTVELIAGEKAGIMRPLVPVAIGAQPSTVRRVLLDHARRLDAPVELRGRDWEVTPTPTGFRYEGGGSTFDAPQPSLSGIFQIDNAGIAITALRAAGIAFNPTALAKAEWPVRLQRLDRRLARMLPADWELWLDGGHNPGAAVALAEHIRGWGDCPVHLVVGMKQAKDAMAFLRPLLPLASSVWAVQEARQSAALPVEAIIVASGGLARSGPRVEDALREIPRGAGPARVLICGSLYLAAAVLKLDTQSG